MEQPPVDKARGLLSLTDGLPVYAGRYVHEGDAAPHTHTFVEAVVVTGGEGLHHAVGSRRPLRAGDVMLLRPGVWHGYQECRDLGVYNCCFDAELLRRELAWMREDPLLGHLLWTGPRSAHRRGLLGGFRLDAPSLADALGHLDALGALRYAPPGPHRADLVGRLSLFLGVLARAADAERPEHAEPGGLGRPHPAVVRAMRLLEERPARAWTVPELAGGLGLSAGYLTRLFKSATGQPPMAYLAQHRVELAAAMLLDTDLPVGRIGREVGWPDPNLFARRFRAHAGLSATAYRQRFARGRAQASVTR